MPRAKRESIKPDNIVPLLAARLIPKYEAGQRETSFKLFIALIDWQLEVAELHSECNRPIPNLSPLEILGIKDATVAYMKARLKDKRQPLGANLSDKAKRIIDQLEDIINLLPMTVAEDRGAWNPQTETKISTEREKPMRKKMNPFRIALCWVIAGIAGLFLMLYDLVRGDQEEEEEGLN